MKAMRLFVVPLLFAVLLLPSGALLAAEKGLSVEQAIREATKFPNDLNCQAQLARAYNSAGEYGKALWVAKDTLKKKPGFAAALLELGHASRGLGHYDEAVEAYRAYLGTNPLSAEGQVGNSESLAHLGLWEESFAAARVIIQAYPKRSAGYEALGRAYRLAGRSDEAIGLLNQGLSFEPANRRIHFDLGLCYVELGDRTSALVHYEKLLDIDQKLARDLFQSIYP